MTTESLTELVDTIIPDAIVTTHARGFAVTLKDGEHKDIDLAWIRGQLAGAGLQAQKFGGYVLVRS